MLVLSRKTNQRIAIDLDDGRRIWIEVARIQDNKVRLAFDAPAGIPINREEVLPPPPPSLQCGRVAKE